MMEVCEKCGDYVGVGDWPYCPHGPYPQSYPLLNPVKYVQDAMADLKEFMEQEGIDITPAIKSRILSLKEKYPFDASNGQSLSKYLVGLCQEAKLQFLLEKIEKEALIGKDPVGGVDPFTYNNSPWVASSTQSPWLTQPSYIFSGPLSWPAFMPNAQTVTETPKTPGPKSEPPTLEPRKRYMDLKGDDK